MVNNHSGGSRWGKSIREAEIARRGGRCAVCGSENKLEFAHVEETGLNGMGRGLNRRARDLLDHPNAYVLLCRGCHVARDLKNGVPIFSRRASH